MMQNFRLVCQYDGTRYRGWQKQASVNNTVQGRLEFFLAQVLGESVTLEGAGRTDAGVHALAQTASFQSSADLTAGAIAESLRKLLPSDISLLEIQPAKERFHARYNAKGKHYRYRIWNDVQPNVFLRNFSFWEPKPLDLELMRKAAVSFTGTRDFRAFFAGAKEKKNTLRSISKLEIRKEGSEVILDFYGDGFLHKMIRILAGTLIEVGRGERTVDSISGLFETAKREDAGFTASASGLFLVEVFYA